LFLKNTEQSKLKQETKMDNKSEDEHYEDKINELGKKFIEVKSELEEEIKLRLIKESPFDFLLNALFFTIAYGKFATGDCSLIVRELIERFENPDILESGYKNTAKLVLMFKKQLQDKRKKISLHRDDLMHLSMNLLALERIIEKSLNDNDNNKEK